MSVTHKKATISIAMFLILFAIAISVTFLTTDTYEYTNDAAPSTSYTVSFNDLLRRIKVKTITVSAISSDESYLSNTENSTVLSRTLYSQIRDAFKNSDNNEKYREELFIFSDKVAEESVNLDSIKYVNNHFVYSYLDNTNRIVKAEFSKEYLDTIGISQTEYMKLLENDGNKIYSYSANADGSIRFWFESKYKDFWLHRIDEQLKAIQDEGKNNECDFDVNDDRTEITMNYKQADINGYLERAIIVCKTYQLFNNAVREDIDVSVIYR